jgi:cell division septum initiation protein DivIVA
MKPYKTKPKFSNIDEMLNDFSYKITEMDRWRSKDKSLIKSEQKPVVKVPEITESNKSVKAKTIKAEQTKHGAYSKANKAIESFKVLAGLTEREVNLWNPGLLGTTKPTHQLMSDFGMESELKAMNEEMPSQAPGIAPGARRKDKRGNAHKIIHQAKAQAHRVVALQHATHSYMHELEPHVQDSKKAELARATGQAAHALRGAMDHAPHPDIASDLHNMASKFEKHSKIYARGGRPKLEAIEKIQNLLEDFEVNYHKYL